MGENLGRSSHESESASPQGQSLSRATERKIPTDATAKIVDLLLIICDLVCLFLGAQNPSLAATTGLKL